MSLHLHLKNCPVITYGCANKSHIPTICECVMFYILTIIIKLDYSSKF